MIKPSSRRPSRLYAHFNGLSKRLRDDCRPRPINLMVTRWGWIDTWGAVHPQNLRSASRADVLPKGDMGNLDALLAEVWVFPAYGVPVELRVRHKDRAP